MALSQSYAQLQMNKLYFNVRTGCVEFRGRRLMNFEQSDIPYLRPINKTWEDKPKSNIVKYLMGACDKQTADIAYVLGTTETYLNNKLHRNSFSFEDIAIVAEACGFTMCFIDKDECCYFKPPISSDAANRIDYLKKKRIEDKKKEYEELMARVLVLKEELGLEEGDTE